MLIGLYTSRLLLSTLGVTDYGIYNVVGGVVSLFAFINSSAATSTQRFLSFELGSQKQHFTKVFSMCVNTHIIVAILFVIIAETAGLWFIYNYLNLPADRFDAAVFIFHVSMISFVINFINIPYTALIIAHEQMNIFAYISVMDVVLKLLVVFLLTILPFDNLKEYALLLLLITMILFLVYRMCCSMRFHDCKYHFIWDASLFKQMFSHANWMLLGTSANVLNTQGVNMLMNIFFNVTTNAARGIAFQLYGATNQFANNFMLASRPQIIKLYANNEQNAMKRLVYWSSKFSFFLILLVALPIIIEADVLLRWWLKIVPENAVVFTRLVLLDLFFVCFFSPLATISQATGKIKLYQLLISIGFLLVFCITYLLYTWGFPSYATFVVSLFFSFIGIFVRVYVLHRITDFSISEYTRSVLQKCFCVFVFTLPIPLFLKFAIQPDCLRIMAVFLSSSIIGAASIWFWGLGPEEKQLVRKQIHLYSAKLKNK